MPTAEPESLNLRDPAEVIAFAQSVLDPNPKNSRPGLRPVISLLPDGRQPNGTTEYKVAVTGEGFGGPASTTVVVDPAKDNPFMTRANFSYQFALVLREIERRFRGSDDEPPAASA
jgi:hypothetical protein